MADLKPNGLNGFFIFITFSFLSLSQEKYTSKYRDSTFMLF